MWGIRAVWLDGHPARFRGRCNVEKLAEMARQIREQAARSQEAQAEVARMMAERRRVAEQIERAWQEHQTQREA